MKKFIRYFCGSALFASLALSYRTLCLLCLYHNHNYRAHTQMQIFNNFSLFFLFANSFNSRFQCFRCGSWLARRAHDHIQYCLFHAKPSISCLNYYDIYFACFSLFFLLSPINQYIFFISNVILAVHVRCFFVSVSIVLIIFRFLTAMAHETSTFWHRQIYSYLFIERKPHTGQYQQRLGICIFCSVTFVASNVHLLRNAMRNWMLNFVE